MRERDLPLLATAAFLTYLDDVYRAAMTRDRRRVQDLLRQPLSVRLPAEVRAEALAIGGAPRASLRAPIRLLQLRERVVQLALGDEDPSEVADPLQLAFPGLLLRR